MFPVVNEKSSRHIKRVIFRCTRRGGFFLRGIINFWKKRKQQIRALFFPFFSVWFTSITFLHSESFLVCDLSSRTDSIRISIRTSTGQFRSLTTTTHQRCAVCKIFLLFFFFLQNICNFRSTLRIYYIDPVKTTVVDTTIFHWVWS